MIFNREPVAIVEVVRLLLVAGVAFGLPLTEVQSVALIAVVSAALSLLARREVRPVSTSVPRDIAP